MNPYFLVTFPRKGPLSIGEGTTKFGSIFHYRPKSKQLKLTLNTQLKAVETERGTQLSLLKNLSATWPNLSFTLYDDYSFNQGKSVDTRLSVGANTKDLSVTGFLEADILNMNWMTGVTYGMTVNPTRNSKLFYLCNRFFEMNRPVSAYGAEYYPSPRFNVKAVVIPWARYSTKLNANFTKNFGGSLVLDYLRRGAPSSSLLQDVNFGLQLRFNA